MTNVISVVLNATFRELKQTLFGGRGAGEVRKKNIRARKNLMKKILARQLTLNNIHATA